MSSINNYKSLNLLLSKLTITCLDIGARGGFSNDLLPIASTINAIGVEPDNEECEILNEKFKNNNFPWKNLCFIPIALAGTDGTKSLNLYQHRGCSSLLDVNYGLADAFFRGDYYKLDKTVQIQTTSLDKAAELYNFKNTSFLKIDIQGMELEVLKSGPNFLNNLMAIRIEVSFVPIYKNQPLFTDICAFLNDKGFQIIDFIELHNWRRTTKTKFPILEKKPLPYSKGELVHGDIILFRDISHIDNMNNIDNWIKLSLIALAYGYIDYASQILKNHSVQKYLTEEYNITNILNEVEKYSLVISKKHINKQIKTCYYDIKKIIRNILKIL